MADAVSFRALTAEHLPALLRLYRQLNPTDPELEPDLAATRFAEMLSHPGLTVMGGFVGDRLAASCILAVIPNLTRGGAPYALIENVITDTACRRRGIGRAMLHTAIDMAWRRRCYKVMLLTGKTDAGTLDFYRSCGFSQNKTGFQTRRPVE